MALRVLYPPLLHFTDLNSHPNPRIYQYHFSLRFRFVVTRDTLNCFQLFSPFERAIEGTQLCRLVLFTVGLVWLPLKPFLHGRHHLPASPFVLASRRHSTVSFSSKIIARDIKRPLIVSVGYLSRKALPIKRHDAEPLTREDVQFALLNYIFSDKKAVFTNQTPGSSPAKITFKDLYHNALSNSNKCSKVLKDKMAETPEFALELSKISLLTNVGRINTTMACAFTEPFIVAAFFHPNHRHYSFSRDEDRLEDLSSCSVPAENGRECSGCPPNQEPPQSRPFTFRVQIGSAIDPGRNPGKNRKLSARSFRRMNNDPPSIARGPNTTYECREPCIRVG